MGPLALKANPTTAALRHPSQPRRSCHCRSSPAIAVAAQQQQQQQQQKPPRRQDLLDPAQIKGSSKTAVPVPDRGGALSLDAYMRLPTEQYSELDPAMIHSMGGSTFLLKVPRVQLFDVWVEPEVVVRVQLQAGGAGLIFESGECRLKGSDLLQRLGLDKRFVLGFHTVLTWQPNTAAAAAPDAGPATTAGAASSNGNGGGGVVVAGGSAGEISAEAEVQVWSEVVGPFKIIPRALLEATGNTVLNALMKTLLPVFLRKLGDDYQKWSTSPEYRTRRAGISSQGGPAQAAAQQPQQQAGDGAQPGTAEAAAQQAAGRRP